MKTRQGKGAALVGTGWWRRRYRTTAGSGCSARSVNAAADDIRYFASENAVDLPDYDYWLFDSRMLLQLAAVYTGLTTRHGLLDLFRHLHPERVEHSWARRADLGYRYDHAHGSPVLAERLDACEYVHETRDVAPDGSRLTDHSGLAVRVSLEATTTLLTSDPTTAVSAQTESEPTLF